jgi:hypothetical protein
MAQGTMGASAGTDANLRGGAGLGNNLRPELLHPGLAGRCHVEERLYHHQPTTNGSGNTEEIKFAPTTARRVRLYGTQRATPFDYSLWEMRVFP